MLELLLGIMIFSLAMLPMLSLSTSSTRGAFSVSKHMMAAQIAQSLLDRFLGLTYDECLKAVADAGKGKNPVGDDLKLQQVLQDTTLDANRQNMLADFERAFAGFTWSVGSVEGDGADKGQVVLVRVEVNYPSGMDANSEPMPVAVSGLKFREDL